MKKEVNLETEYAPTKKNLRHRQLMLSVATYYKSMLICFISAKVQSETHPGKKVEEITRHF